MTVAELIEALQGVENQDQKAVIRLDAGEDVNYYEVDDLYCSHLYPNIYTGRTTTEPVCKLILKDNPT